MFPQVIFLAGRNYPCAPRGLIPIRGAYYPPPSYAWFCPVCAEIWARAVVATHRFHVMTHPCEKHLEPMSPMLQVSGSLLLPMEESFNESLPEALVRRELELHIKFLEAA